MRLKILIGDDAPFIRDLIRSILSTDADHMIFEAEDGLEACAIAAQENPQLIFLDLAMPNRNGIEAASIILEKNPKIHIYVISSLHDEHMVQKAVEVGCKDFIPKPFEMSDILNVIKLYQEREVVNG